MPRQVNINVNVDSAKAVKGVQSLKKAFEDLGTVVNKELPKDGIKIKIDTDSFDIKTLRSLNTAIRTLSKNMNSFQDVMSNYSKTGNVFNVTNNKITNNIIKQKQAVKELNTDLIGVTLTFEIFRRNLASALKTYSELNSATFGIGIAGQMNLSEIDKLNESFLTLATTVPATATEMAKAVDDLIRTGRSYEDSRKIIEQVAVLSTASGDSLKDTAQVVTKVMVALGISGDRVKETLTSMHSTAIQTASDMGYLAEGFKNVAGTVSVMATKSGLAGEELDDYKQSLLDVTMASIGAFSNLGLSASQAGTKVKQAFGRLTTAEKVARNMFDDAMKLNNVKIDGDKMFDFDALSKMAQEDLPKALEFLSKLTIEGKVSQQVLQKMFTARHFMDVSHLLTLINGDIETFVNGISKGVDYSADFQKKMYDVNEQVKLLKNNIEASFSTIGKTVTDGTTGVLLGVNSTLSELNNSSSTLVKLLAKGSSELATMVTMAGGLGIIFGKYLPILKSMFSLSLLSTPAGAIGATIGAIGYGVLKIGERVLEINKGATDLSINLDSINATLSKTNLEATNFSMTMDKTLDNFYKSVSLSDNISNASTLMDGLLSKSKDYKDVMSSLDEYQPIDVKALTENSAKAKSEIDFLKNKLSDYSKETKKIFNDIVEEMSIKHSRTGTLGEDITQNRLNIISLLKYYDELKKSGKEYDDIMESYLKKAEDLGVSSLKAKKYLEDFNNNATFQEHIKEINSLSQELSNLEESYKQTFDEANKQINKNLLSINKLSGYITSMQLDLLSKTGQIELSVYDPNTEKLENKIFSGWEAITNIEQQSFIKSFDDRIKTYETQLENIKIAISNVDNIKFKDKIEKDNYIANLNQEQEKLNQKIESENILRKESLKNSKQELIDYIKKQEYTSKNVDYVVQLLGFERELDDLEKESEKNPRALLIKQAIDEIKKQIDLETRLTKEEKNRVSYQITYKNHLKEMLDYQLEMEKIGRSIADQNLLSYQYKLKELKANQDINTTEKKSLKTSIEKLLVPKEFDVIKQDILNQTSAKGLQEIIDNFYIKYTGILSGQDGKMADALYDALNKYTKSTMQSEKISSDIRTYYTKALNDFVTRDMPQITKNLYSNMSKMYDLNMIFGLSVDSMQIEEMKSEYKDLFESIFKNDNVDDLTAEGLSKIALSSKERLKTLKEIAKADPTQENVDKLKEEEAYQKNILELMAKKLEISEKELETELKKLDVYNKMGNVISSFGEGISSDLISELGDIFSNLGDFSKASLENKFSFKKIFDFDAVDFADNFSKAMESALKGVDLGSTIGSWIGSITGGGASAQAGGTLGGLISGLGGANALANSGLGTLLGLTTGGAGTIISAGMSLIGGLFGGDEEEAQAEAERRTKEQNKIYDKNTEALNKLAQNMSNLSGGIDGLNNTLVSAFSKLPTVGNLNNVTDSLKSMYKTMEKTRNFEKVAYQVTKHESGKSGFLGIGAKPSKTWTETIEVSVDEMLRKYGYYGSLESMSTDQLREFSKWLDDYDLGDSDNFSVLADALEDYAEALDKFDKNIDNFFRDTTMESFEGISSLQQEELRQQIEDFYKNLGFQIDDEMAETIDKLAEEMSVMVTIMQDVRNEFVNNWRETGEDAGSLFVSSMKPYVDAMLNNISQIYYDVFFSGVTEELNKQFKELSEQLVELKKQGEDLDWDSITGELSDSFDKVLNTIISASQETENFNSIILELQKQALESGLSLSEIFELGLTTGTQSTVIETFKDALMSSENDGALKSIGNMLGEKIGEAMTNKMIDNLLSDKVLEFSAQIDKVISGGMNFDNLAELANEALSVGLMMQTEANRLEAIKDLFSFNDGITYETQNDTVEYSSGVSTSVNNYYNLSLDMDVSNLVESDSIERLADDLLDIMLEKLKVDKGIDLR